MSGVRIITYLLVIMHILPIAITQLLIIKYPFGRQKNGWVMKCSCTVANLLLNGLVLYEIIMYSKFNFLNIINFTCSYQDISRLATSNIISLALSVLIGAGIFACAGRYYKAEHFFHVSSICALLIALAMIPIILGFRYGNSGTSHLEISEICRKTTVVDSTVYNWSEDAMNDGLCYVAISNNGILSCELDPVYLSADIDDLKGEKSLSAITIKPGETYRFYMPSDQSLDIKKSGGTIVYLSDEFGNVVDSVEVPALNQDQSYISMEAGWQVVNLVEEVIKAPAPSFSRESGFYDTAFELELTAEPGTTIYYTLDSSNPTVESKKYSRPIRVYDRSGEPNRYRSIQNIQNDYLNHAFDGDELVDKCFVVRAIAVDEDGNCSDIVTKSYFINKNEYKGRTVLSLVSDPDGLFGDDGIYVTGKAYDEWYMKAYENGTVDSPSAPEKNYNKKGIEWERESSFEVFEDAQLLLAQQVGIRIQGGSTRSSIDKRFSIYSRKAYGTSGFFDVNLVNDFRQHSLYLRLGQGHPLHIVSQMLGRDRAVLTTDFIEVDLFLDGEYWYSTYLCEKFAEQNIAEKYGLTKDNIVQYKAWKHPDGSQEKGKNPASNLWNFVRENDLSNDENYLKYCEMLDMQSYVDWLCINIFMQNMDYYETANTMYWHTVVRENGREGDSKWRMSLYDMDIGWTNLKKYGDFPYYEGNPFTMIAAWEPAPLAEWPMYSALRSNDRFCKQFILTFMDLINTNFSVENTMSILDYLNITSSTVWDFFENRIDYVVPYVTQEFALTGTQANVTLSSNVSGSPITLNTISPELRPSRDAFSWTGSYFTDYPVTVTAAAPNFSHWEITVNGRVQELTDKTIEVPVSAGGVQIHAVFK